MNTLLEPYLIYIFIHINAPQMHSLLPHPQVENLASSD